MRGADPAPGGAATAGRVPAPGGGTTGGRVPAPGGGATGGRALAAGGAPPGRPALASGRTAQDRPAWATGGALPSAAVRTGLASFDVSRWTVPPVVRELHVLDGAGLLRTELPAGAESFEAEAPPQGSHVLLWRLSVAPGRHLAWLDGRPVPSPGGLPPASYVLPAGMRSRWVGPAGPQHHALHLHLTRAWLEDLAAENRLPACASLLPPRAGVQDPPLEALVRALVAHNVAEGGLGSPFAEHWIVLAALRLMGLQRPPSRLHMAPRRLARVVEQVEAGLHGPIGLGDMAAAAGMSRFHFARAFRAETGETPHAYVTRRRCERAKALILAGDASLAEVARRCGFAHQAHLTTAFRRVVGTTPGRWRDERRS